MKKLAVLFAVALSALGATSAFGSSKTVVSSGHTSLGTVLVNAKGLTLYLYEGDSGTHLGCAGDCLSSWPELSGSAVAKGAAKASELGTIKRGSGTQVTYDGHPLYTFAGDAKAGQTNGEGIVLNGKKWYAVSPSGAAISAGKKSSSSSSSSSSGAAGW